MRPTEKKAIIRSGASESVKNRDAVSPKKLVANKKGIISIMTYSGLPISGRPNIKGINPNRNKAKTAYNICLLYTSDAADDV